MDYNFTGKRFVPVEGEENKMYHRDTQSNAIVMTDGDEYSKYMQSYNERQRRKSAFTALQKEVNELKSDVTDIKSLLMQLVKEKTDAS